MASTGTSGTVTSDGPGTVTLSNGKNVSQDVVDRVKARDLAAARARRAALKNGAASRKKNPAGVIGTASLSATPKKALLNHLTGQGG